MLHAWREKDEGVIKIEKVRLLCVGWRFFKVEQAKSDFEARLIRKKKSSFKVRLCLLDFEKPPPYTKKSNFFNFYHLLIKHVAFFITPRPWNFLRRSKKLQKIAKTRLSKSRKKLDNLTFRFCQVIDFCDWKVGLLRESRTFFSCRVNFFA